MNNTQKTFEPATLADIAKQRWEEVLGWAYQTFGNRWKTQAFMEAKLKLKGLPWVPDDQGQVKDFTLVDPNFTSLELWARSKGFRNREELIATGYFTSSRSKQLALIISTLERVLYITERSYLHALADALRPSFRTVEAYLRTHQRVAYIGDDRIEDAELAPVPPAEDALERLRRYLSTAYIAPRTLVSRIIARRKSFLQPARTRIMNPRSSNAAQSSQPAAAADAELSATLGELKNLAPNEGEGATNQP